MSLDDGFKAAGVAGVTAFGYNPTLWPMLVDRIRDMGRRPPRL